jgi:hypothetical protein
MLALEHKKPTSRSRAANPPTQQRHKLPQGANPIIQRASCACGGSCPSCQAKSTLKVGAPDDAYEREADAVADRVMRMAGNADTVTPTSPGLQRKCAACEKESEEPLLQAKAESSSVSAGATFAPASVDAALRSPGHALDAETRAFFEPRFGQDFGGVQVHSDSAAQQSARDVSAHAYTVGHDIVFGRGQFAPETFEGRRLLAHELAHAVQQSQPSGTLYEIPLIQRQSDRSDEGETQRGMAGAHDQQLRDEYIAEACGAIEDIRAAVEEGRTWDFEIQSLLQSEESRTLVDERWDALQELVRGLDEIIQDLESGALVPTELASRWALAQLWVARNPAIWALAERWVPIIRTDRLPSGVLQPRFPALDWYITETASSPPRVLPAAGFPTWWVIGCHSPQQPGQSPAQSGRGSATELGLSRDLVVYLNGLNDERWDWEPRGGPYHEALGPIYDWQEDEAGHVFIVVDGQQRYLLRDGRVEIQR